MRGVSGGHDDVQPFGGGRGSLRTSKVYGRGADAAAKGVQV